MYEVANIIVTLSVTQKTKQCIHVCISPCTAYHRMPVPAYTNIIHEWE